MSIQKVIDSADILDIVSESVELKKSGSNYKGLCPFHSESTPSFIVSPKKGIFKCFGCGESGDALSFYMKIKKLPFMEAIKELAARYKIELEVYSNKKNSKYYDLLKESSKYFRDALLSGKGKPAMDYLRNKRGFSQELIFNSGLGYAPFNGLVPYLKSKGFLVKDMEVVGLSRSGKDLFRNRVMFTIFDYSGKVIGFGGRSLDNTLPKYINSKDSIVFKKGKNLYGISDKSHIREKDFAILVEGYTDVLALKERGIKNSLASLGTAFTSDQAKLLRKLTNNVIIMYDSDKAGELAAERAIYILKSEGFNVKVCSLGYKDPDEFLKKESLENLKLKMKNAEESFDFLFRRYYSGESVIEKKKMIYKFKDFLRSLPNNLELEIYLNKLSEKISLSVDSIKEVIGGKSEKTKVKANSNKLNSLETQTLSCIAKDPSLLEELSSNTSFKRSKISFLIGATNDNIEEMIKLFTQANKINLTEVVNLEEARLEVISDWDMKRKRDELEDIEELLNFESKGSMLKAYYEKKKEIDSGK
ncbi:MAG TPA: DNA primase [Fusobacteria bacterium]|nr:DNA primase [Fusobacteriota bacterium]|tara:strand:- start:4059 stop:5654 length:1596 start_codon:yes stop_codon:yes gene_type:complete